MEQVEGPLTQPQNPKLPFADGFSPLKCQIALIKIYKFLFLDKRNSTGNLYFGDTSGGSENSSHGFLGASGRLGGISSSFGHSQPIR